MTKQNTTKENTEFNNIIHKCFYAVDDSQAVYNFQHIIFFNNMPKAKVNRLLAYIDKAALDTEQDAILAIITKEECIQWLTALRGAYRGILSYGEEQGWIFRNYQFK